MVFFPQTSTNKTPDPTMTLIGNIYTNNVSNDIFGGNLLIEIVNHLTQFKSVEKDTVYKVQPNYYKRYKQKGTKIN